MKQVTKDFSAVPAKLLTANCTRKVKDSLAEKGDHKFSTTYYASDDIKTSLSTIYNHKCAFCENNTTAGASLQVEHYRPKAKVTEDVLHSGYYWLGYQWSNLLYACSKCNRSKANFFPIKNSGTRVSKPSMLPSGLLDVKKCKSDYTDFINEEPLLINPELTNPRLHLLFLPTGKIKGKTDEGKETILKCKLYRSPLVIARKKIISDVLRELKLVLLAYHERVASKDTVSYVVKQQTLILLRKCNENDSFSELARTALLNFEYFFIRRFGNQRDQSLIRDPFKEIKLDT